MTTILVDESKRCQQDSGLCPNSLGKKGLSATSNGSAQSLAFLYLEKLHSNSAATCFFLYASVSKSPAPYKDTVIALAVTPIQCKSRLKLVTFVKTLFPSKVSFYKYQV